MTAFLPRRVRLILVVIVMAVTLPGCLDNAGTDGSFTLMEAVCQGISSAISGLTEAAALTFLL